MNISEHIKKLSADVIEPKKLKITTRKRRKPAGLAGVGWLPDGYDLYINGEICGGVSPSYSKYRDYNSDIIWASSIFENFGLNRWVKYWKKEEVADKKLKEELQRQIALLTEKDL